MEAEFELIQQTHLSTVSELASETGQALEKKKKKKTLIGAEVRPKKNKHGLPPHFRNDPHKKWLLDRFFWAPKGEPP